VRGRRAEVDWDEGAGEGWLRVLADAHLVALVSTKLPFVFLQASTSEVADSVEGVTVVAVSDFYDVQLSCSLAILGEIFGASPRFRSLDPDGFSANDLWYATV